MISPGECINLKVLKKSSIILLFIVATKASYVLGEPYPDLCPALKTPNSLLLNHFSKINLKKICARGPLKPRSVSRKATGCYYRVPISWATNINYSQLSESGMILISHYKAPCPILNYKDFEIFTLKGRGVVEDITWETFQVNQIKRILKRDSGIPPKNSPYSITPENSLEILFYKAYDALIPLIHQIIPLKNPE